MAESKAPLFDRLKVQFRDTLVSYLCASMPASLLKQYPVEELISCLQLVLTELRNCIGQHGLEDVTEEDPTTVSEEMRQRSPQGWLSILQTTPAAMLTRNYDVSDLVDTLQILAQISFERLGDELGPITAWADATSPLRAEPVGASVNEVEREPSLPPSVHVGHPLDIISESPEPTPVVPSRSPERSQHCFSGLSPERGLVNGTRSGQELRTSPVSASPDRQLPQQQQQRQQQHSSPSPERGSFQMRGSSHGSSFTGSSFGVRTAGQVLSSGLRDSGDKFATAPQAGSRRSANFDATLGPAPWEQEASKSQTKGPVFDATLGPAPWESPSETSTANPTPSRLGGMSATSRQPTTSRARPFTTNGIGYHSR